MKMLKYILGDNCILDSAFSWFIALCACLYGILTVCFYAASGVVFVLVQDRYNVTKQKASYPINTLISTSLLFGVLSGPILHRFKTRRTLLLSACLGALGSALSVFNPLNDPIMWLSICMAIRGNTVGFINEIHYIFGDIIVGFGASLAMSTLAQVVSSHFAKHRATALMIYSMSAPLAGLILPSMVRLSAEEYGLESSWLIHAAVYIQSLVLALVIRPRKISKPIIIKEEFELRSFLKEENLLTQCQGDMKMDNGLRHMLKELLREKAFYIATFAQILAMATNMGFRMIIVDYGRDINLNDNMNRYILEIMSFAEIARIPTALIIDKRLCYEETLFAIGSLVTSIMLLLLTVTSDIWFVITASLYNGIFAVCAGVIYPMFATLGVSHMALSFGIAAGLYGVVQLALPFLIGLFRDVHGSYDFLFYTFSSLNFLLAILLGISRMRKWFNH